MDINISQNHIQHFYDVTTHVSDSPNAPEMVTLPVNLNPAKELTLPVIMNKAKALLYF